MNSKPNIDYLMERCSAVGRALSLCFPYGISQDIEDEILVFMLDNTLLKDDKFILAPSAEQKINAFLSNPVMQGLKPDKTKVLQLVRVCFGN